MVTTPKNDFISWESEEIDADCGPTAAIQELLNMLLGPLAANEDLILGRSIESLKHSLIPQIDKIPNTGF